MRTLRLRNRTGASLAIVAISLVGLLAVSALAIDVGMMFSARNEAQRVADSAALAGASEFYNTPPTQAEARRRAHEFVKANYIMSATVDTSEATVVVDMANRRVHVAIERLGINTWFARILGIHNINVKAAATAELSDINTGGVRCVRPWAVQDLWHEQDAGGGERLAGNGDHFGNGDNDRYQPVPNTNPATDPTATGYGSYNTLHQQVNGYPDLGMQIALKAQRPSQGSNPTLAQPGPGEFLIWEMPDDPTMEQCGMQGTSGNAAHANAICGCNNNVIHVGRPYQLDPGDRVGPMDHGMRGAGQLTGLMGKDPGASWSTSLNQVVGSNAADWRQSARIVPIALMAPLPPPPGGGNYTMANLNTVTFTNFALMFIESYNHQDDEITGRFLYYASGANTPGQGPLIRRLRLIE